MNTHETNDAQVAIAPVWSYSPYRATLKKSGKFFALVSPDMKNALNTTSAQELCDKLNAGERAIAAAEKPVNYLHDENQNRIASESEKEPFKVALLRQEIDRLNRRISALTADKPAPVLTGETPEPDCGAITPEQAVAWLRSRPPHHWNFLITGPQIADLIERLARDAERMDWIIERGTFIEVGHADIACDREAIDQARRGATP